MTAYGSPDDPNLSNRPPHEAWPLPEFTPPQQSLPQAAPQQQSPQLQYVPHLAPYVQQVGLPQGLPPTPSQQIYQQPTYQYHQQQPQQQFSPTVNAVAEAIKAKLKRLDDIDALRTELAHAISEADFAQRRVMKISRMLAAFDAEPQQPAPQQVQQGPIAGQYTEPVYAQDQPPAAPQPPAQQKQAIPPNADESVVSLMELPGLHQNVASALMKHNLRSVLDVRLTIQRMAKTKEKIPGIGPAYAKAMDAAIKRWDKSRA